MQIERNRTRNYDLDYAFQELAFEATDPDILEMRTTVGRPVHDDSDPWLSRCHWSVDLFDAARMNDIARRG